MEGLLTLCVSPAAVIYMLLTVADIHREHETNAVTYMCLLLLLFCFMYMNHFSI